MQVTHTSPNNSAFSNEVCIIGTGMVTSIGYNSSMTAASVRANLSRFSESYIIDKAGEPMLLSIEEFIEDGLRGLDRLLALAVPAVNEAIAPLFVNGVPQNRFSQVPICLGLAAARPGYDSNIEHLIIPHLEAEIAISFSKTKRFTIPAGHASGLMGTEKAVQLIRSGKEEFVLVGGVDSYYDPHTLEWLDEKKRLHSEENKDGFIPGEAAGFCLVASMEFTNRHNLKPLAMILSVVSGEEPNPFTSDGICIGEGLTKILHRTLAVLREGELANWTICDMNGESFRANEWMYAYLRTGPKHGDPLEIWHPADCYGDIGAASGLVLAGIGIAAWQRNYAHGCRSLIWTSSDGKHRSAILLEKPKGKIRGTR